MHNSIFLWKKLRKPYKYNECILDKQQHEAVIACESAQLVLASAGSGKTLSLMAKIEYIIKELQIPPPQILVVSFTKKTVKELIERCASPDVEIQTFHSLGNSLLRFSQSKTIARRRLVDGVLTKRFVRKYVRYLCCHDQIFANHFNNYLLFYYSAPQSVGEQRDYSARIRFNQLFLRHTSDGSRSKEIQLMAN